MAECAQSRGLEAYPYAPSVHWSSKSQEGGRTLPPFMLSQDLSRVPAVVGGDLRAAGARRINLGRWRYPGKQPMGYSLPLQ